MNRRPDRATISTNAMITLCAIAAATTLLGVGTSTLPVYPGATKIHARTAASVSMCGHNVGIVSYRSAAAAMTIAKWYSTKIPGATTIDISQTDSVTVDTEIEVFVADGSQAAVIHQMTMTSAKMQAAAASIGANKTGSAYLALATKASHGDAAAKKALSAKCPAD
jgi:hypothetical protein